MHSEEILRFLRQKNFIITLSEYLFIIENPQVREVHYNDDKIHISTDDGYNFSLKLIDNKKY